MQNWQQNEVLMAVKAYPTPSGQVGEAVCTAGVDREGNWVRVFPVAFRDLAPARQFKKYQWIRARLKKSGDPRPESYEIDHDSIQCLEAVGTQNKWSLRKELIAPHIVDSVEALQTAAEAGVRTMGYVRPANLPELVIEERPAEWGPRKAALLAQGLLFGPTKASLERIPFRFAYRFRCAGAACGEHNMQILDWEVHQAYRSWRYEYGAGWREKFVEKFGPSFFETHDVLFNLGNIAKYPQSFCITGLFYPLK